MKSLKFAPVNAFPWTQWSGRGESDVNQAPITGEPLPVDKKPGDNLFAGTLNGARVLVAEALQGFDLRQD